MHETEPDRQFGPVAEETNAPVGASDTEKIIITLLMRIYDLQFAQLYLLNPTTAEEVFESHEKGELGNPKMWIPDFDERKAE